MPGLTTMVSLSGKPKNNKMQTGSNLQNRRWRSIDAILLPCGSLRHGFGLDFRRRPNKLEMLFWQHVKNLVLRHAGNGNLMCLQRRGQSCYFQFIVAMADLLRMPSPNPHKPSPPAHACAACHPAGIKRRISMKVMAHMLTA